MDEFSEGTLQSGKGSSEVCFAETREKLNQARHLPPHIYDSPELYQNEKDEIFLKDWLCIARVEEIEKPGDYITRRIMEEPIILARNKDGVINAFANVCKHRGVEVAAGDGNLREFSCPYHGWTYDLDGCLVGAPYMKEANGFDPNSCRLTPLHCSNWAGWVFVNFRSSPTPLSKFTARFDQSFGMLHQEDCRMGDKFIREVDCNWKFVNENLMDVYHFQTLHSNSFGEYVTAESFSYDLDEHTGGVAAFYPAAPTTTDGISRFGKMPWLEGFPMTFARMGHLAPTLNLFARIDSVVASVIWPLGPNKTRMEWYTLFPSKWHQNSDFIEKVAPYHELLSRVVEEDREMVASLQRNMGARRFQPGPMSLYEVTVHNIINGYLDRMFGSE